MTADGHLLIILHQVPQPGTTERTPVLFWRTPQGDWTSTGGGSGLGALQAHFEQWRKVIDDIEDLMQQPASPGNYFAVLQKTTPLLRTIRNTSRVMQDAREVSPDRAILIGRDEAGELERAVDLLHHDAKNGMEFMIAVQGEEQAQRAHQLVIAGHRLNLLMALFLPLTAAGSIFSMHLANGLENWNAPWMFWCVVGGGLLTGSVLVFLISAKNPARQHRTRERE